MSVPPANIVSLWLVPNHIAWCQTARVTCQRLAESCYLTVTDSDSACPAAQQRVWHTQHSGSPSQTYAQFYEFKINRRTAIPTWEDTPRFILGITGEVHNIKIRSVSTETQSVNGEITPRRNCSSSLETSDWPLTQSHSSRATVQHSMLKSFFGTEVDQWSYVFQHNLVTTDVDITNMSFYARSAASVFSHLRNGINCKACCAWRLIALCIALSCTWYSFHKRQYLAAVFIYHLRNYYQLKH